MNKYTGPPRKYDYMPRDGRVIIDPGKLRYQRDAKGLTREQLAELVRVSLSTVESYEHGRRCPKPPVFRRLYTALGIGPEDLLFEGSRYIAAHGADDLSTAITE